MPTLRSPALLLACALLACCLASVPARAGAPPLLGARDLVTLSVRETPIAEVFELLSKKERVNILLGEGVEGDVSVNLFEVSLSRAIRSIAESGGYVARRRGDTWMILKPSDAGLDNAHDKTLVRAFKVQYSDAQAVGEILSNHLSSYGELTSLPKRRLIVVEDLPEYVARVERLLAEVDQEPVQILIEARILEISLTDEDAFGIDWVDFFTASDGDGSYGLVGLVDPGNPGFFFEVLNTDIFVFLNALQEERRVRTLATPSLLALEHQEAEVVIGDRLGFRVTTTVNQVTSESVEFLESGVILKFTASVDRAGRVLLDVHPEVSTGVLADGLPSQTTTEVSTQLLINDGEHVFIGGLINDRHTDRATGMPYLSDLPLLGRLFTGTERIGTRTETVVLLSAHVRDESRRAVAEERTRWVPEAERDLEERRVDVENLFEDLSPPHEDDPPPAAAAPEPRPEP